MYKKNTDLVDFEFFSAASTQSILNAVEGFGDLGC